MMRINPCPGEIPVEAIAPDLGTNIMILDAHGALLPVLGGFVKRPELCTSQDTDEFQERTHGCGSIYKHVGEYFTYIQKETLGFKSIKMYEHNTVQSKLQSNKIPSRGAPLAHSLMITQHISADGERFIGTTKSFLLPPINNATATSQHGNHLCLYLEVQGSAHGSMGQLKVLCHWPLWDEDA